jgi:YVTN family beta-propeller protein
MAMWPGIFMLLLAGLFAVSSSSQGTAQKGGMLLVAEKGDQSLAIVDPAAGRVVASIAENGVTGHEVAASSDGRLAFVPIYGDSGVGMPGSDGRNLVVIDIATRKAIGNVDFGHGVRPHFALLGPKDGLLYVTTELDQTVTIIDPRTLKVVGSVPTGQPESHMLILTHDGRRGYTANVGPGTVSVLDMEARKPVAVIPVSKQIQRISISNDDRMVFTSDQTKPQLIAIDTATNQVKSWVPLPGEGYGTAPTRAGRWLLVAMRKNHQVAVVDLGTMKVARTIDVPAEPQEVLARPDGRVAYVSCDRSNQVAEIDLASWRVARLIPTGKLADGLAWAGPQ